MNNENEMKNQKGILEISDLEKKYISDSETLTVLKDLNLCVENGSKIVIVGESGCGKSTLLNIIGGIDTFNKGKVTAGKWNVGNLNEKQLSEYRSKFLGLIFQFHYLLKDFTALENVFLPAFMAGVSKKHAMEKAEELLCAVGLKERMSHLPSELSGGERQRVSVARSLVNNPELILADEPTGNLDPANAEAVGNLLFSLSEKYGKTLILVTHDMNLASKGQIKYSIENGQLQELEI